MVLCYFQIVINRQPSLLCSHCTLCPIFTCCSVPSVSKFHKSSIQAFFFFFFWFLELHLQHMEASRLGQGANQSCSSQPTPTRDLNRICDLYHSSWQCQILNLLSKTRDRTCNLIVPSQIHFPGTMMGTPAAESYSPLFLPCLPQGLGHSNCSNSSAKQVPATPHLNIWPMDRKSLSWRDTCTLMFIAAICTTAKVWKVPKCPSMDKWIKKMWYIHTQ